MPLVETKVQVQHVRRLGRGLTGMTRGKGRTLPQRLGRTDRRLARIDQHGGHPNPLKGLAQPKAGRLVEGFADRDADRAVGLRRRRRDD